MGAAPGAAAGAREAPPLFAVSTSRAMMRPWGPEPCTRPISIFASLASRRASGEEKTRFPSEVRAPSPAAFGGDLSPLGRGEEIGARNGTPPAPAPRWGEGCGEGDTAAAFFSGAGFAP